MKDFDKLWDYNDPAGTEIKFRELLDEVKNSNDKSAYLQLETQIARTLGLQMKFDDAHKLLDEVESELTDDLSAAKIRYLLERGRVFNSSKQKDKSRDLFLKAYEIAKSTGEDFYAVDAAHMMGIIEPGEESLKWNETAMKDAESSESDSAKGWLGSLYNNTGWTYFDMKDYEKALELFLKCRQWHEERKKGLTLAIAKWSVAKTLRMMGKTDESLDIQLALLKDIEDGKAVSDGYVYEELMELYLIKNEKEKAAEYAGKSYELLSKDIWVAENEKDKLERLKKISEG
ncbi:MAG: hypothetical protein JSS91_03600 [Bacteroidetes bacterium]|nr:hypothetical protein [Bacteroidota bacterium]